MSIGAMLFSFRGRMNRQPYWLINLLAMAVATGLIFIVTGGAILTEDDAAFGRLAILLPILAIPLTWIGLATGVKRLHDRNKSAWWLLVFYVLPSVLDYAGGESMLFGIAGLAIFVWALVELGFLRGTSGPNDYGPDPLAPPEPGGVAGALPSTES